MDRLVFLILLCTLFSCDNLQDLTTEQITFHFTDNVPSARHKVIADYITDEIREFKLGELKIKDIKIDSVPFSIVLYIPYSDQITKEVEGDFKSLANLVSHLDFDDTPVHVVLTDEAFNPKKNLTYDKDAVTYTGTTMTRGRVKVEVSESAAFFSPAILEEVLRNRMPELYKGKDSVNISVDMVDDTIKIDFNIDRKENNLDTLRKQFLNTDKLFFDLLFERKTVLFHVREKQSQKLITVFGVKGE
jgi:hypothetical protein